MPRPDLDDLPEADGRIAQRLEMAPVGDALLPAAPLEIVVDDGQAVVLARQRRKILEGPGPQHVGLLDPDQLVQLFEIEIPVVENVAEMLVEDVIEKLRPVVPLRPPGEPVEPMLPAHPVLPKTIAAGDFELGLSGEWRKGGAKREWNPLVQPPGRNASGDESFPERLRRTGHDQSGDECNQCEELK